MRKYYKRIPRKLLRDYDYQIRLSVFQLVRTILIFPYLYCKRRGLFAMGFIKDNLELSLFDLYWLANNTEHIDGDSEKSLDFVSCWYGDLVWREKRDFDYDTASDLQRYWISFLWFIRNNGYNWKKRNGIKFEAGFDIVKHDMSINTGPYAWKDMPGVTVWRNETILGEQGVILNLKGTDEYYFRYSYTVPLPKLNVWRIFGYTHRNRMRGVESHYLYKNRLFNLNKE
jgi:hypothetical protein